MKQRLQRIWSQDPHIAGLTFSHAGRAVFGKVQFPEVDDVDEPQPGQQHAASVEHLARHGLHLELPAQGRAATATDGVAHRGGGGGGGRGRGCRGRGGGREGGGTGGRAHLDGVCHQESQELQ